MEESIHPQTLHNDLKTSTPSDNWPKQYFRIHLLATDPEHNPKSQLLYCGRNGNNFNEHKSHIKNIRSIQMEISV